MGKSQSTMKNFKEECDLEIEGTFFKQVIFNLRCKG